MSARRRRQQQQKGSGVGLRAVAGLLMIVLCGATVTNTVRINELRDAVTALQKENDAWRALVVTVRADIEEGDRALPAGPKSEPARQKLRRATERINDHLKNFPPPTYADGNTSKPPPERE